MTGINDTASAVSTPRSPNIYLSDSNGVTGNAYWFTAYRITDGAGTFIVDGDRAEYGGIGAMSGITSAFALDTESCA